MYVHVRLRGFLHWVTGRRSQNRCKSRRVIFDGVNEDFCLWGECALGKQQFSSSYHDLVDKICNTDRQHRVSLRTENFTITNESSTSLHSEIGREINEEDKHGTKDMTLIDIIECNPLKNNYAQRPV